jgi:hypothetical protein
MASAPDSAALAMACGRRHETQERNPDMLLLSATSATRTGTNPEEMADAAQVNSQAEDSYRIEEIARRAHQIHREHGGLVGYDFDDWTQAWQESSQMGNERQANFVESRAGRKHPIRLSVPFRQIALHAIFALTLCFAVAAPVKAQTPASQEKVARAVRDSSTVRRAVSFNANPHVLLSMQRIGCK